jgi:hypothetical protein
MIPFFHAMPRGSIRAIAPMLAALALLCARSASPVQAPAQPANAHAKPSEAPANAQAAPVELYRIRIENALFGPVEVSADSGQNYALIGRVQQPATTTAADAAASTPGIVLRSGDDGMALAVAPRRILKVVSFALAHPPGGQRRRDLLVARKAEPDAIVTDLPPGRAIFGRLRPPAGAVVRMQMGLPTLLEMPETYTPAESDRIVIVVSRPVADAARTGDVAERIKALAGEYAAESVYRARAARHEIVAGTLTLRARLPQDEPDPIVAVTYAVDGDIVAAQNTPPYSYAWDTRRVPNGEHVVEIRGLNAAGATLTKVKSLVVVRN